MRPMEPACHSSQEETDMKRFLISAVLAVTVLVLPNIGFANTLPVSAASFTVTSLAEGGPGSLREAIDLANTTPGPDTIKFSVSGVIHLSSPLTLTDPGTTIDGRGQNIVVDGSGTAITGGGLFNVSTSSAAFKNFAIQNVPGNGNGIFASGDSLGSVNGLTVSNMVIGGGIGGSGILILAPNVTNVTVTGSTISGSSTGISVGGLNNTKITIDGNPAITSQIDRAVSIGTDLAISNSDISISGNGTIKSQFEHAIEFVAANNSNISVKNNTAIEGAAMGLQIGGSIIIGVAVEGNKSIVSQSTGVAIGDPKNKSISISRISISRNGTIQGGETWYAVTIQGAQNRDIAINNNASLVGDWNGVEVSMATDNNKVSISGNGEIIGKNGGGVFVQANNSNSAVTVSDNKSIIAGAVFGAVEFDSLNNSNIKVNDNAALTGSSDGDVVFVGKMSKSVTAKNSGVVISNNSINGGAAGIHIIGSTPGSNNRISGNTVYQNKTGVELSDSHFVVARNTIRDNSAGGFVILAGTGNRIDRNNITGNVGFGLKNTTSEKIDATCNWWGQANGPTNAGNPGGAGDAVIGDAGFIPWLIAPAPGGACGGRPHK